MSLKLASTDNLLQIAAVVGQLSNRDYAHPLPVLSQNSIGKHVRHVLEFYELLIASVHSGQLNYDRRNRDLPLEVDTDEVIRRIEVLKIAIHNLNLGQTLHLKADLSVGETGRVSIPSTVARELLYNIEHAIHHMALIQIALREDFPTIEVPPHFGVASSTVKHQVQE